MVEYNREALEEKPRHGTGHRKGAAGPNARTQKGRRLEAAPYDQTLYPLSDVN